MEPSFFATPVAKAVFWTLVHSLWIGLIAAALAGLVVLLTKRAASSLRYRWLCGLLASFTLTMGIILCLEMRTAAVHYAVVIPLNGDAAVAAASGAPSAFRLDRFTDLLDQSSGWGFMLWLLCFLFKSIQLVRELFYIRRVCRQRVLQPGDEWTNRVRDLALQLGIKRTIVLLESALVKVPVTVGYIKPFILLPLGMICGLPPEQVDSILWHELAHIVRRDYVVGILQSIVEALFFFNPAVRWLSALIREERESCCDDIALAHVPQKRNYLEALMAFHGAEDTQASLSMGLSLRNHQLMNRLRRMVHQENQKLNGMEKIALLTGIFLLSAFTFLRPGHGDHADLPLGDSTLHFTRILFNKTDADRANREMWARDDRGNRYHLRVVDGRLVEMEINDAAVREPGTHLYVLRQVDAELDRKARHIGGSPQPLIASGKRRRPPLDISDDRHRVLGVIDDLVKERVVPDANAVVWFGLSSNELIVNGIKQSDALHQRLKDTYGIRERYGLYYGPVKMVGTGVFLEKGDL